MQSTRQATGHMEKCTAQWSWRLDLDRRYRLCRHTGYEHHGKKYSALKTNPLYSAFAGAVTVIGVWDDHDYGLDDGGKEYPQKTSAQMKLLDFSMNRPKAQDGDKKVYIQVTVSGRAQIKSRLLFWIRDITAIHLQILETFLESSSGSGLKTSPIAPRQGSTSWFPASRSFLRNIAGRNGQTFQRVKRGYRHSLIHPKLMA